MEGWLYCTTAAVREGLKSFHAHPHHPHPHPRHHPHHIILILMTNPAHPHPHPHGQSCSSKPVREGPLSCEPPQQRERVQSQSRQQSGRGPRGVNNKHAGVEICDHFCLLDGCHDSLFKSLGLIASQGHSLIFSSVVEIYHLSASFIITSHLGLGGRF